MSDETRHSPEPWRHNGAAWMWDGNDQGRWMQVLGVQGEANARRLVACVNACAGIPTAALENGWLKALLDEMEQGFSTEAAFETEWEHKALEMLGRLGGPPACVKECKP